MSSLEARHRQAQLVVSFVYLGIPLVFLGLTLWIVSAAKEPDWLVVLIPLVLLAVGWWRRGESRLKPARWTSAGTAMGSLTALCTALFTGMLESGRLAAWFLPVTIAGAILGAGFGRYGFRTVMSPAIAELAESAYELSFRIRGLTRLRLSIDAERVALHEQIVVHTEDGRKKIEREKAYPLTAVTGVFDVSLSGAERLRFPVNLRLAPAGSPGPALILQVQGDDWVLPQNEAPAIAQILDRRIASARTH
ncbi:hypothetical protein [Kribbella sp. CA-293567]|uniref:hypothetical protein n=1 Tax=Kribbella sp. CA-293567 TaxID=3002436 RepID=UPI0022DD52D6|nr:hypothetical protein [Kribbella sp. CA-293567]WBQ05395.1 hypothetical protein OX958_01025 [Kribbella sp. CA-293567]